MGRGWTGPLAAAAVAVAALALASAAPAVAARRAVVVKNEQALAAAVLVQVNDVRRAHHLVALRLSVPLSDAAQQHSRQMATVGYFEHESADGSAFWKRIERFYPSKGASYWSVGENLLWASPSIDAPEALKLWMTSPEHRKNLLTPRWRDIGLSAVQAKHAPGVFHGLDVTIVTADFGVRR